MLKNTSIVPVGNDGIAVAKPVSYNKITAQSVVPLNTDNSVKSKKSSKKIKELQLFRPPPPLADTYEGEYNGQGERHGKGILRYASGDVYEGYYMNDKMHGRGKFSYANDKGSYDGEWKFNKFHGTGTLKLPDCTFEGEYENGMRNGKGTMSWENGAAYSGYYKDDKRHGQGHYVSPPGTDYDGEFFEDEYHGVGLIRDKTTGMIYQGDFVMGKKTGKGTLTNGRGETYVGEMVDFKMNGQGHYTYKSGRTLEGRFVNDLLEGIGKSTNPETNTSYEGMFVGSFEHGKGVLKDLTTGEVLWKGEFRDGEKYYGCCGIM